MPIKAGNLAASTPGRQVDQIFDGNRMRVIWAEGDGDGEPSEHLIERTLNTVKGHPTWKVFCGDVPQPIVPGVTEPPHYVYLDDQACYDVWRSQSYSKSDLKTYWPFDFDKAGNVKWGRMNRGRPAYLDKSGIEYALGTLRDKKKMYEFCGAPSEAPLRAKKKTKKVGDTEIKSEPSSPPQMPSQAVLPLTFPLSPLQKPVKRTVVPLFFPLSPLEKPIEHPYPERYHPDRGVGNGRVPWKSSEEKPYVTGPLDGNLLTIGMPHKAAQGSPYFDEPAANRRSQPRPRDGDMAGVLGMDNLKRKRAEVELPDHIKELARVEAARPMKRKHVKSGIGSATHGAKRGKIDGRAEKSEPLFE